MESFDEVEYDTMKDLSKRRAERGKQYEMLQEQESSSDEEEDEGSEVELDKEKEKEREEEVEEDDDDDMFASDTENLKSEEVINLPKKAVSNSFDMEKFRREEQLGIYDEENDNNKKSLKEEDELDDESKENGIKYYTNVEDWQGDNQLSIDKSKLNVEVEEFDIKDDEEDGQYDADGNFIRNKDQDEGEQHDSWMKDVKTQDIKLAKAAQDRREVKLREESLKSELLSTETTLRNLIEVLVPAESPLEALSRLKPKKKKTRNDPKDDRDLARRELVFKITEYCDVLIEKGVSDVYDTSREGLMRQFRAESGEDFQPRNRGVKRSFDKVESHPDSYYEDKKWEYRWDNEVEGPHSSYEMQYWSENYFDDKVMVRQVGEIDFQRLDDVLFE